MNPSSNRIVETDAARVVVVVVAMLCKTSDYRERNKFCFRRIIDWIGFERRSNYFSTSGPMLRRENTMKAFRNCVFGVIIDVCVVVRGCCARQTGLGVFASSCTQTNSKGMKEPWGTSTNICFLLFWG